MMNPRNVINMAGGIVNDPRLVNDDKIANFRLAINGAGRDSDKPDDKSGYFDVVVYRGPESEWVFGQLKEGKMKKGSQIHLVGRINQDRFTDKNDQRQSRVVLVAESVQYFGSNPERTNREGGEEEAPAGQSVPDRF